MDTIASGNLFFDLRRADEPFLTLALLKLQ
jgi:hypothetical protein